MKSKKTDTAVDSKPDFAATATVEADAATFYAAYAEALRDNDHGIHPVPFEMLPTSMLEGFIAGVKVLRGIPGAEVSLAEQLAASDQTQAEIIAASAPLPHPNRAADWPAKEATPAPEPPAEKKPKEK